ncbi:MAG: ABC transporter permease [Acholeplasmatales bacterium]|nr:ABC transporter permease [Acholeplasmatales bacterium]
MINKLKNPTFIYIVKRIISSIITLILILAVVTALLRLIPEEKLYDISQYNKIKASAGLTAAENFKNKQLFLYGRKDSFGNDISVFSSILKYIYWILPIPKEIPVRWNTDYTEVIKTIRVYSYFGKSITRNEYVLDMLLNRIGISFMISIISLILSYLISYPLGIAMAKKPGGIVDKIGNIFVVINYAIPALVFYMVINSFMGNANGIFGNLFSYIYMEDNPLSLIPPIFSLVFLSIPGISIWVRRYTLDEMSNDYVKFARSKGLSQNKIMYTHVLRNAMVPLIRSIPIAFIGAIIGSYYVEKIWNIPGTGALLISSLQGSSPDVACVQGLTVIYAALSMLAFLVGDIITALVDPRIRLKG